MMPDAASAGAGSAVAPNETSRPTGRGFRTAHSAPSAPVTPHHSGPAAPALRPTTVPHRPKGRWLIGCLLLCVVGAGVYAVWDSFFRYQAYGVVQGRVVQVSAPWNGQVTAFHVREGEYVRQGQLLATLENFDVGQEIDRLADETRLLQARLHAEVSRLRWAAQTQAELSGRAQAEYFELWGVLLQEQSRLEDIDAQRRRTELLRRKNVATLEEFDNVNHAWLGQRDRVSKLTTAVEELRLRAEKSGGESDDGSPQLQPLLAEIDAQRSERYRLRQKLEQGQLRSPVSGLVVRRLRFPGERIAGQEPLVEVVEEDSLQVALYVPQAKAADFAAGQTIDCTVPPYADRVRFEVVRVGDQFEAAPDSIHRHYKAGERLLPIYLRPGAEYLRDVSLRVGATVKLPHHWPWEDW